MATTPVRSACVRTPYANKDGNMTGIPADSGHGYGGGDPVGVTPREGKSAVLVAGGRAHKANFDRY